MAALIYFFSLKSFQVRLRTGSKSIVTPKIVNTEVAEADDSCLVSPPKSLKIYDGSFLIVDDALVREPKANVTSNIYFPCSGAASGSPTTWATTP